MVVAIFPYPTEVDVEMFGFEGAAGEMMDFGERGRGCKKTGNLG